MEKAEERFRAGAAIRHVLPGVAIEQGYVPLNVGAKFRVVAGFRAAKSAIGHPEIKRRVLGHTAKKRRHVLNGMRRDSENAVVAVRDSKAPGLCGRGGRSSGESW